MKKSFAKLCAALVLAVILLVACTPKSTSSRPNSVPAASTAVTTFGLKPLETRQTLRVGFFSGSPHSIPFYIAEQEGFWNELNIDIEYQPFINGPAMMEANASWDIADVGGPGALVGQLGHDLRMVGICDYEANLGLFVRSNNPIVASGKGHVSKFPELYGKAQDYRGMQWLYPVGTNLHLTLAAALESLGLSMDDIKSVNMDVSSALTAFRRGEGDGLAVWNNIAFAAEDAGFIRVADAGKLGVTNACALMATPNALNNKRELIKKAWQTYYLTWQWANESSANMQKARDYFLESCENEGVASDKDTVRRSLELFQCPSVSNAINVMSETRSDNAGLYTKRPLLRAENDLLQTLDFFIGQNRYSNTDRLKILDNNMVDPSLAKEAKADFESLGIAIK